MNRSQNETKGEEITGFFLAFSSEEITEINEFLKENEYEPGTKGLKEFVLDSMFAEDEPDEPVKKPFFQKVAENPEMIQKATESLGQLFHTLRQKKTHR